MSNAQPVVMFDDDEAASIRTVTGWVSRDGFFFGSKPDSERMARYAGCTHRKCATCGEVYEKNAYCVKCHQRENAERYATFPEVPYTGQMVVPYDDDHFLLDEDDIVQLCADRECTLDDLRLVDCDPVYAEEIDPSDHYHDDLPEDGDVPPAVADAFAVLNATLRELRAKGEGVLCWRPANRRVVFDGAARKYIEMGIAELSA